MEKKEKNKRISFYVPEGIYEIWEKIASSKKYLNQQDAFRTIIREEAKRMGIVNETENK